MSENLLPDEWDRAYVAGLDAAREAVSPQNICSAYLVSLYPEEQRIAISALELAAKAIDALREKRLLRDYSANSQQNAYNNPQGVDDGER